MSNPFHEGFRVRLSANSAFKRSMSSDLTRGWIPVRGGKTRQNKNMGLALLILIRGEAPAANQPSRTATRSLRSFCFALLRIADLKGPEAAANASFCADHCAPLATFVSRERADPCRRLIRQQLLFFVASRRSDPGSD
jgi:hypothetical protein